MRSVRRSTIAVLGLLVLLVSLTLPAVSATAAATSCTSIPGLAKAPALSTDIAPAGESVREQPLSDGSFVPVVMVHGWTGRSAHTEARDGAFSALIDLTAMRGGTVEVPRSLIGQTQDIPGATVYTFDYHETSARWVTDPSIGSRLAEALHCLALQFGHPVIVVAHSMGGLATRQALSMMATGAGAASVADEVSDVITFGTPNTGSWIAAVANGALEIGSALPGASGTALIAVRSLLTVCGTIATASMETGACGKLPAFLAAFDSQAGRALQMGSSQLRALPPWPTGVRVHALSGDMRIGVTTTHWFGLTQSGGGVAVGDLIVRSDSANAGEEIAGSVRCDYSLDVAATVNDDILQAFRLLAPQETNELPTDLTAGPCFHGNLMRDVELANDELRIVAERIGEVGRSSFFVGDTEFVRIDPWSTSEAQQPLTGSLDLDEQSCYQASSSRTDYLRCGAGMECFVSPDESEALCGGGLGSLDRVSASGVTQTRREDWSWQVDYSAVGRIAPIEFETANGDICRPRWTGTGLFGPAPYGASEAYCTSVEDREGALTLVVWGSPDGASSEYGEYFVAPGPQGFLQIGASPGSDIESYVGDGDQYEGPLTLVDVVAVYY